MERFEPLGVTRTLSLGKGMFWATWSSSIGWPSGGLDRPLLGYPCPHSSTLLYTHPHIQSFPCAANPSLPHAVQCRSSLTPSRIGKMATAASSVVGVVAAACPAVGSTSSSIVASRVQLRPVQGAPRMTRLCVRAETEAPAEAPVKAPPPPPVGPKRGATVSSH